MRTVSLPEPHLLRIVTDRVTREYRLAVWQNGPRSRTVELSPTDLPGTTYHVVVNLHPTNQRYSEWHCDCPAATHRSGQCKHVLALKAGLRSVGVKV